MTPLARHVFKILCVATILFSSLGLLPAQEFRATLSGIVRDPTGAVVPNAKVTATKKDSGQIYSATTNAQGFYTISYLIPGDYQVTVEAQGFNRSVRSDVPLAVADKRVLDFSLQVGNVRQEITVSAAPPIISTADASGGTVMGLDQVQDLPLNGRQVYMLLQLTPGIMFLQTQFGSSGYSGTRGWDANNNYSMGGGWTGLNQFLLNGSPTITDEANGWAGGWYMSPNEDAIQEFKVMTNTYDAEYGRTGGGVVNTTLKAGTNQYHGTAFDYFVTSALNANSFTNNLNGAPKGLNITHQYGGTMGGPVKRNKAFFFGSFEGYHEVVPFPVIESTLPSSVKILPDGSIDFSATGFPIYDPLTTTCVKSTAQGCSTFGRTRFPNDTIPGPNTPLPSGILSRVNPIGLAIVKLYPAPTIAGLNNNYIQTGGLAQGRYRYYQPMGRIDYSFSEATRIYGLAAWQRGHEHRNSSGFPYPIATGNIDSERDFVNAIFDLTHIFSPVWLVDLQASFGRFHQDFPEGPMIAGLAAPITAGSLGLNMPKIPTTSADIAPQIRVDGYRTIIGNNISQQLTNNFDFRPVFTHIKGRHNIRVGGEMEDIQFADLGVGRPLGFFTFGTGFTQNNPFQRNRDGFSFASLALGAARDGSVDWNETQFETWHYYAGFIQDDFRASRSLTFNLGLRWDVQTSTAERFNRINAGFCFTCSNPITSQINYGKFPNLPNPLQGGLLFAGKGGAPRAPYWNFLNQWQPRIGIAYTIRPKTVIRAGYGILYAIQNQHDTRTGFTQATSYVTSLDGGRTPSPYFGGGTPYPNGVLAPSEGSLGLLTNIGNGLSYDWGTRRIPRSVQWSIGFQQELPRRILLDLTYAGNYTNHMTLNTQWDTISESQRAACQANNAICDTRGPNPFLGIIPANSSLGSSSTISAVQLMRPYPEFTGIAENTNPGSVSRWHAFEFKLEKRAAKGLTLLSAFTYQKEFERNHYLNNGTFRDALPIREVAYFDRTYVWDLSGVWQLPIGAGKHFLSGASGAFGELVNGWEFDWTSVVESGVPTGVPDAYFTCSGQNISVPHRTFGQWFNNDPSCWQSRPPWSARVMPDRLSYIRNPYEPQINIAMQKRFRLSERFNMQFRGEAFNVTNTPIFPGPSTDINTKPQQLSNGSWTGLGTVPFSQQNFPRNVQLSLKLMF